ncbi:MAG: M20/M25/M40 family metallo-hydrolase [Methanobacteriota archaeon]|nr:MAG: M20/M25/M40 family metallo-hydrolase [Euryarchaeota archaeon]
MDTIVHLQSFDTRDYHTSFAMDAASYILDSMHDLGLGTELQEFEVSGFMAANVIAVLNPEAASRGVYIVGAHYDSENSAVSNQSEAENITAPGADDNASGVAVMLEIARILSESECELCTVKFVAFGAEESGYDQSGGIKGSAEFVASEAQAGTRCDGAIIMDMVGYRAAAESRITLVTNEASSHLANSIVEATTESDLDLAIQVRTDESLTYSDHSPFWSQGLASILIIEELNSLTNRPINPYYHTSQDTADRLSLEQMTVASKAVLAALLHLTDQGEDSYHILAYGVVAATVMGVVIIALLLLRKRKGET